MLLAEHERLRRQQRHDDGSKAAAVDVGAVGVDQRLRVDQQFVAAQEEAEGVPGDLLPRAFRFHQPLVLAAENSL
jgi:hypothetical protein